MKQLSPGCNAQGWKSAVECIGGDGSQSFQGGGQIGCGALLEITKDDLYTVHVHDVSGPRNEVRCLCICCGAENTVPNGKLFRDLPGMREWVERVAAAKL